MALSIIREHIAQEYHASHLLDSLPSHELMEWVPLSIADPPTALIIGTTYLGRKILAFLVQHGDKPREVRYCVDLSGTLMTTAMQNMPQEDVMQERLIAPFKYIADTTKVAKRKSSILVKWYFMLKGLWTDGIIGDYVDYCKRFHDALRKIDAGRAAEETTPFEGSRETPMQIEDSPEPEHESTSAYKLRSIRSTRDSVFATASPAPSRSDPQSVSPLKAQSSFAANAGNTDYDRLCRYLDLHGFLYLLDNIPDGDGVDFHDQHFIPEAQPKKLFVGRLARDEKCEIYAYMRPSRNVHEIRFWAEDPRRPEGIARQMSTEEVAKQRIVHPFNKTYPKDGHGIDQGDRARFTLMVKWYFIAAGIVKDVVLQETKAYPERLRSALEYIAVRMGPAAVGPSVRYLDDQDPQISQSTQPPIDESHIQSTLADGSPTVKRSSSKSDTPLGSPRGTKRTAEDAHFEDLAKIFEQDQVLTKKIKTIDNELEALEDERMRFLEKWEKKNTARWKERNALDSKRGLVRKQFKRQTLAMKETEDGV